MLRKFIQKLNRKSYEKYLNMLNEDIYNIAIVPKYLIDEKMSELVMNKCPRLLYHIPDKYKTYEMCLKALKYKYDLNINFVPKKYITRKLYLDLIEYDRSFIKYVPKEMIINNKLFRKGD